ncbi:hypothetical protein ACTXT7_015213 [Hymenolepis weldensis]
MEVDGENEDQASKGDPEDEIDFRELLNNPTTTSESTVDALNLIDAEIDQILISKITEGDTLPNSDELGREEDCCSTNTSKDSTLHLRTDFKILEECETSTEQFTRFTMEPDPTLEKIKQSNETDQSNLMLTNY